MASASSNPAGAGAQPDQTSRNSAFSPPSQLKGRVSTPGYADLDTDPFSSLTSTVNGISTPMASERSSSPPEPLEDDDVEDYDDQEPDPDAIVHPQAAGKTIHRMKADRPTSIPITLEKTSKKGRYMLHADDVEVSEILRAGILKKSKGSTMRDLVFTRRFTTFDRQNPSSYDSPFYGFFTLFWIAMALLLLRVAAANWKAHGSILGQNQIMKMMFSREVFSLGLSDAVLVGSTVVGVFLQKLCAKGYIDWARSGYIIQNVWQTLYVGAFVGWTFYRDWPWTHTIFMVLHGLVFLMKQHSYAFYNGYLSQILRRKELLERKLMQLEGMTPINSPVTSPLTPNTPDPFANGAADAKPANGTLQVSGLRHRRKSSQNEKPSKKTTNLASESDDIAVIQGAITAREPITADQMDSYSAIIKDELDALASELRGKCAVTENHYPSNLTLANWAEWSCLPTLVYELEYPRQPKTNWAYVAEKTGATFGTLVVMMVVSQAYIYPPVAEAVRLKDEGVPVAQRWEAFPWIMSDILFPLLIEQLLTWYVIWECILNVLAEFWCFADRGFYGPWWNSTSWDQYARDWNRPVHNFLLRHVYHSSISAFHLSKGSATFVTFLLSALVHELVMFCLFKKVRGYLLLMQLLQMPLVMLSRTPPLKNQPTLGNVIFWIGLFVGPSVITSLYLVI